MRRLFSPHPVIVHDGHELPYEIVRDPRVTRKVYLRLGDDGRLLVVAPKQLGARAVHRHLQDESSAVMDFLERARATRGARPSFHYTAGEKHLYQGCWYPLRLLGAEEEASGEFDGDSITLRVRSKEREAVLNVLRLWYRARAAEHFGARLAHYCERAPWTGGRIAPLRLRRMKRTLGSCSRKGHITMNPHLVKAPEFLIDYVIAHEVCHLAEHNHGRDFYALQDRLFPDWRAARNQLKTDWHLYVAE